MSLYLDASGEGGGEKTRDSSEMRNARTLARGTLRERKERGGEERNGGWGLVRYSESGGKEAMEARMGW